MENDLNDTNLQHMFESEEFTDIAVKNAAFHESINHLRHIDLVENIKYRRKANESSNRIEQLYKISITGQCILIFLVILVLIWK